MRKQAMINSFKDSIIAVVLFAITYGVYEYSTQQQVGNSYWQLGFLVSAILSIVFTINFLAALGASTLYGNSYSANKSKYTIRAAIFNEDKKSSVVHFLVVSFYYLVGAIVFPIAFLVALFNLRSLFSSSENYDTQTQKQKEHNAFKDMNDISVKGDKNYKLRDGLFKNFYFYDYNEALRYAITNNINDVPTKV
ncbi:MAG: hypothetical protein PHU40_00590 [Sulfurimonas sp.]|nr:hypothetical protein [Sulfurimonas sp.]